MSIQNGCRVLCPCEQRTCVTTRPLRQVCVHKGGSRLEAAGVQVRSTIDRAYTGRGEGSASPLPPRVKIIGWPDTAHVDMKTGESERSAEKKIVWTAFFHASANY